MPRLRETLQYKPEELSFGTSGLRGLVTDMTDLECYINTAGFLRFLQRNDDLQPGAKVYVGGDLRTSTPRIMATVHKAVIDAGYQTINAGLLPTPALAYCALQNDSPCIMVTGSHIPADRNGIKFYKRAGEVLKEDEAPIKDAVSVIRQSLYDQTEAALFGTDGMFLQYTALPTETSEARDAYVERFTSVFSADSFAGKELVFYQHSSVGRDILVDILKALGATVKAVGRSDTFVSIDTENVTIEDQAYFRKLAQENPNNFAIVSTDGDSDRPFVVDADGEFHRGDVLGAIVAEWLQADFAAFPVSSSDATDAYVASKNIAWQHTKIGSPYVVEAMEDMAASGKTRVTGWEVNGGFLLGADMQVENGTLKALPTRDALLPIIVALLAAVKSQTTVAEVFAKLPARFTQAGLIDNFPNEISREIVARFAHNTPEAYQALSVFFSGQKGYGAITSINTLDGVRIFFDNDVVAHLRPSGNAPQLRIYSVADSQETADKIVAEAIAEPNGIFRQIEQGITA